VLATNYQLGAARLVALPCRVGPRATPHTFDEDPDSHVLWHIGLQASQVLTAHRPHLLEECGLCNSHTTAGSLAGTANPE
jgi:DNA primase